MAGKPGEALRFFDMVFAKTPSAREDPWACSRLIGAYVAAGQYENAIQEFGRVRRMAPERVAASDAVLYVVRAYEGLGKAHLAQAMLRELASEQAGTPLGDAATRALGD